MGHGRKTAFAAGLLAANSTPHLHTALRGQHMLTPLGGADSGPGPNLLWGGLNLAAAGALAVWASHRAMDLRSTVGPAALGAATFGVWAVVYERVIARGTGA